MVTEDDHEKALADIGRRAGEAKDIADEAKRDGQSLRGTVEWLLSLSRIVKWTRWLNNLRPRLQQFRNCRHLWLHSKHLRSLDRERTVCNFR
jgi:hypothetical protein